jgi:hypothetical protein
MNKIEITQLLQANHQEFMDYLIKLTDEQFDLEKNNKWTPGQHLEHINLSVKPLLLAYGLPSFIPRLMFGKANRPSSSFEELVKKYQGKLAAGGRASGAYIPPKVSFTQKQALLEKLKRQLDSLVKKVSQFSENQLDTLILPHPLIGKITFREMLYFTAYHVQHHQELVKKNI